MFTAMDRTMADGFKLKEATFKLDVGENSLLRGWCSTGTGYPENVWIFQL